MSNDNNVLDMLKAAVCEGRELVDNDGGRIKWNMSTGQFIFDDGMVVRGLMKRYMDGEYTLKIYNPDEMQTNSFTTTTNCPECDERIRVHVRLEKEGEG